MGERRLPTTLLEFQRAFPDEGACAAHLEKLRWPKGFVCPMTAVDSTLGIGMQTTGPMKEALYTGR